ncbi:YfhO family protein [Solimicrobium silvestre]|nr:YfhO family protein [Solimicrobium silvestre]
MVLITILALIMWRFPLFTPSSVFHGDMIGFGLPLFNLAGRAFSGHASLLWASGVYGGHPIFAEGQGAFANPLTFLIGTIITPIAGPIFAMNFFQFICLLLTGAGMLGLCRQIGFSAVASAFSALAVTFSPFWIYTILDNPVGTGTFLWVPWCLWSLEKWLQQPNLRSSVFLGSTCTAMLLAGYTPGFHATVLYMGVRVIADAFNENTRNIWINTWSIRIATGIAAILICIGLSAIQWLPLLELIAQSHRNDGTGLTLIVDVTTTLRGMFYGNPRAVSFVNIGSPLILALALCALSGVRSIRITGHLFAAIILIQLGCNSPFFRFVYDHNLIPGIHYVRITFQFLIPGIIGIILIAGSSIDAFNPWFSMQTRARRSAILFGVALVWITAAATLYTPDIAIIQLGIAITAFITVTILLSSKYGRFVPITLLFLLTVECSMRLNPFQTANNDNFKIPTSVLAIKSTKNWQDYKVLDTTVALGYAFHDPHTPNLTAEMKVMLYSLSGLTSTLWGINSMDGALALPLKRHTLLTNPILNEINGTSSLPPGLRLIDTLGIRYISTHEPAKDDLAFRTFLHSDGFPWIIENTAAMPRFQIYQDHVTVDSPEAALAVMQTWTKRTLVIENAAGSNHQIEPSDFVSRQPIAADSPSPANFEIIKASDTHYHLNLHATKPCWLFLADANYPGWKAYLDGKPVPVFSAQVQGKAVAIPEGQHQLEFTFESSSFRWGACISFITLMLTTVALLLDWRKRIMGLQLTNKISGNN